MSEINICESQGIPEYLWPNGRDIDQMFDPNEILLRRFRIPLPDDFKEDDTIGVEIFEIRDDSYNRLKYCLNLESTLFNENPLYNNGKHFHNYGVLKLSVESMMVVEEIVLNGILVRCELIPIHVPKPCNFSHTEAWFFIDGVKKDKKKPPSVKTMFRRRLLKKLEIVKSFQT